MNENVDFEASNSKQLKAFELNGKKKISHLQ